ncbi:MAG: RHS repeat-associated core domain-containing protein [Chloroherpetonaceae bacterium]
MAWRYYIKDAVGNVVGVADDEGRLVRRSVYDAWGFEYAPRQTDGGKVERRFIGLQYDSESDLYHAGVRQYDARLGLFLQPEPLYDVYEEISPYSYAMNSPLVMQDASGMSSDSTRKGS